MDLQIKSSSLNFTAMHIANCEGLKLYKITDKSDFRFLKHVQAGTKLEKLLPNLSRDEYSRWNEMLEYAVYSSSNPGNITYLETFKNKPCGIITFFPDKNNFLLDCICTWSVEFGKKVKLAGQTLFYQLFKDFSEHKAKKIKLYAITNGPVDTVSKYKNLNFKETSNRYATKVEMEISAPRVKETINNLDTRLNYEPVEPENVNLFTVWQYKKL